MRLNAMLEPQEGLSYEDILGVARRAERLGLEGLYRSDHYSSVAGREGLGSTDAWATLAGVARETSDIVIGTMVSPVTFRPAGNLAKVVATVAEMAGTTRAGAARVHLGMGTGWMEAEHRQHGFPFEDVATRFRRLEEHLQAVLGLWDPDRAPFEFDGEFVQLAGSRFAPVPSPRPRIIVGGKGRVKTPRLAARFAEEVNVAFPSPAQARELGAAQQRACEDEGRDPATLTFSVMTGCLVGSTEEEFRARARRLQERVGDQRPLDEFLADKDSWVLGTPERAAQRLGEFADAGVERVMLQMLVPEDFDMLDVVASEVGPRL